MAQAVILTIFLLLGALGSQASEGPFSNNAFVVTQSSAKAVAIAKSLPSDMKVIARHDQFLIIAVEDLNQNSLKYLRKINGVVRVQRNYRARYLAAVAEQCSPTVKPFELPQLTEEFKCMTLAKCGRGETHRLWAQKFVGTDLAQSYLKEKGVARTSAIGVVDSGFDQASTSQIENAQGLSIHSAVSGKAIEPDVSGHGSCVVSMIKGHQGIGGSVESRVSMYGLGKSNDVDMAEVGLGILKTCEGGLFIERV